MVYEYCIENSFDKCKSVLRFMEHAMAECLELLASLRKSHQDGPAA